jgi:hypothetical protein
MNFEIEASNGFRNWDFGIRIWFEKVHYNPNPKI